MPRTKESGISAYRVDVRDRLRASAREMHELQATSIALVSNIFADSLSEWSRPVQMRIAKTSEQGILEFEFRFVERPE